MCLRHLVTGFKHITNPMPGQVSASLPSPQAAWLTIRLALQHLWRQVFIRGALAQRRY
jgi:hypothetical protein